MTGPALERASSDKAHILFATPSPRSKRARMLPKDRSFHSRAAGVGNNPDAIPSVWGTKGGSGETMPLRIIPERREFPEHLVQSARAKG